MRKSMPLPLIAALPLVAACAGALADGGDDDGGDVSVQEVDAAAPLDATIAPRADASALRDASMSTGPRDAGGGSDSADDSGADGIDGGSTDAEGSDSSDAGAGDADAGTEGGADSGSDPGVDSGSDAGADSGTPWTGTNVTAHQSVGGYESSIYSWQDENNQPRSCALVDNDVMDPSSFYGGYVRQCTYQSGATTIVAAPRPSITDHPGWGYTVHHLNNGADADTTSSRRAPGAFRTVFAGRHHVMHEYTWTVLRSQGNPPAVPQIDRAVSTTIRYLFATGVSYPVWAHTIDTTGVGANAYDADDRAPYGELKYDGVEGPISGLGWGDHYRFRTMSSPVDFNSKWDYSAPETIPHTVMWTDSSALEMGVVQTESYTTKDSGYGWFYTNWGKTSANRVIDSGDPATQLMPNDWNWTYQLNQYNIPTDANSKRMGWGLNLGGVGMSTYSKYGDTKTGTGYPYRSSSAFLVLGAKGSTDAAIANVKAALGATLTAAVGTVATTGPFGIGGASAWTQSYGTAGYDPVYGVFTVAALGNVAHVRLSLGAATMSHPMLRVTGYDGAAPATIVVNGETLHADQDFFASAVSFDGAKELWLTLNRSVTGDSVISIN